MRATVILLVLGFAGCAGVQRVEARLEQPALVPVRAFPRIFVASGHEVELIELAQSLTQHLRRGGASEVQRLTIEELEPMRMAGQIPTASVVVLLSLRVLDDYRPAVTARPRTVCGTLGCYTRTEPYHYEMPITEAALTMTVYDGPTANRLQQIVLRVEEEGRDYAAMRRRVVLRLATRLSDVVDQRVQRISVALLDVEHPEVRAAIAEIDAGDWTGGRERLERLAESPELATWPAAPKARVLYDLALARRFDPTTLAEPAAHFDAAEAPLRQAIQLDPRERYGDALRDLREHRRQLELLLQQRQAAQHNFAIEAPRPASEGTPAPPASYQ